MPAMIRCPDHWATAAPNRIEDHTKNGRPRSLFFLRMNRLNLDFDEDIGLNESDCGEPSESADVIDNIPVNPDVYVARDGTDRISHNNNVPRRFVTRNVLRPSSDPTSFAEDNVNVSFL
ncbi:uncharacterized protein TNCV_4744891 [Trichonephila clavipes]|nr:uncharacterized protein TNCV_4744891 [Trichonephila clavipes]